MAIREILTVPDPRLKLVSKPVYAVDDELRALMDDMAETMYAADGLNGSKSSEGKKNDIFDDAVEIVLRDQKASISYLQRRLSIGYNRAATLIERMEEEGIISASGAGGKREILIDQY